MKHSISLKLLIIFATLGLFNLNANQTSDNYVQAFRAAIRFNNLYLHQQAPALSKLINDGIAIMEKNSVREDAFFKPNHVTITKTRLWQYARAEKPKTKNERALLRTEFIQELTILRNFFTHFRGSSDEDNQISITALETINQFERDFS
ncbi:hypothetical protein JST56_03280 [Candidatus Dependentiae bacterium]|nr:hypothetical protein [Candidatus Dependentiae bacterium]